MDKKLDFGAGRPLLLQAVNESISHIYKPEK